MQQDATDEHLMLRLLSGDDSALATLMGRWEAACWCFIDRMCGRLGCTEDIYQDVWTRLYVYRSRYDPGRPFRSYLFAIAANCSRRALSKARRQRVFALTLGDDPPIAALGPQAAADADAAEQTAVLHRAIESLPDRQRATVLLYLLFSTDYARVAEVLGCSVGTVRSNMHHALGKLRGLLNRAAVATEAQVDHGRLTH